MLAYLSLRWGDVAAASPSAERLSHSCCIFIVIGNGDFTTASFKKVSPRSQHNRSRCGLNWEPCTRFSHTKTRTKSSILHVFTYCRKTRWMHIQICTWTNSQRASAQLSIPHFHRGILFLTVMESWLFTSATVWGCPRRTSAHHLLEILFPRCCDKEDVRNGWEQVAQHHFYICGDRLFRPYSSFYIAGNSFASFCADAFFYQKWRWKMTFL